MRVFICIDLPDDIKNKISNIQEILKEFNNIKLVEKENLHITLKFLGEISEQQTSLVVDAVQNMAPNFKKFEVSIQNIGAFPNFKSPKVIWLDITDPTDTLVKITKMIDDELYKLGFQREKRDYKPHLTLARVKNNFKNIDKSCKRLKVLQDKIREIENITVGKVELNNITVMQSTLTPKGPIYKPIKVFQI